MDITVHAGVSGPIEGTVMGTTLKDVARLAKVSVGTASQVINGKGHVRADRQERVLAAIAKLNYRPNQYAKSLVTSRSSTIGLIVTDVTNPFFGTVIKHVQQEVESRGYTLLLGVSNDSIVREHALVDYFLSRSVEGIILVPANEPEIGLDHLYALRRASIPFVYCTTFYPGLAADCVMTDLKEGSLLLTRHLIGQGLQNIRFLSGDRRIALSSMRIQGFLQAFKECGIAYDESRIRETVPDFDHGYRATVDIIAEGLPDAIVAINDVLAIGTLKCLRDRGIRIPAQVSVAGYDNLIFSAVAETPLTTVNQPIADICQRSVDLLFLRIAGDNAFWRREFLKPELILRDSTLRKPTDA